MSYSSDIQALSPSHYFKFDGNATDEIAALTSTETSIVWTSDAIAQDATYCMKVNATDDTLALDSSSAINNKDRFFVAGWVQTSAIQQPPTRFYGDGGGNNSVEFHLGFGNILMYEIYSNNGNGFVCQIYSDVILEPSRNYHIALQYENSSNGNFFKAWLDGVPQLDANNTTPDGEFSSNRDPGIFGTGANSAIGGTLIKVVTPVNAKYNHWGFWADANASAITTSVVRETLFEKGVLPDITVSSQTDLDNLANSARPNAACCIAISEASAGAGLTLEADNVTFDPLASIHIQWLGTGTLIWTNTNGSNASIISTPNGGSVDLRNERTVTFNNLQPNTEIRIFETGTINEIAGVEDVNTGSWSAKIFDGNYDIRIMSVKYRVIEYTDVEISSDTVFNIKQFFDKNYSNP
jgi:hypothetical protein